MEIVQNAGNHIAISINEHVFINIFIPGVGHKSSSTASEKPPMREHDTFKILPPTSNVTVSVITNNLGTFW